MMKILAFTDIHGSQSALRRIEQKTRKENPDLLLCAGDVSIFERGLFGILRNLNGLGKKILIIHGNHEGERTLLKLSKQLKNIIFIHNRSHIEGDILFLGYGGGGFSIVDRNFEKSSKSKFQKIIAKNEFKKIILMTHAPPYGTRLDRIGRRHCGNKSVRRFIEKNNISIAVSGHLHENFGKEDKLKKTTAINPGPFGKIINL